MNEQKFSVHDQEEKNDDNYQGHMIARGMFIYPLIPSQDASFLYASVTS